MRTMGGWCLPVEPKVSADVLDGPISFLNRLAEIAVFQERPLSTLEQQTVDDFTMVHEQTGERRLCSRDWWLKWYGYLKTPVQPVLDTLHTCTPVIFSVTGSAAPADAVGAHPCGRQRLCADCEKALSIVDGTYCLPVMVDVAVAVMVKAQQLWATGDENAAWTRSDEVNRVHSCSRTCPFASA